MRFEHARVEYTISDEWWSEAGMKTFSRRSRSFLGGKSPWPDLRVFEVAIGDVRPLVRNGTHGVFNDSIESGSAHDRVVRILRGFCDGAAIPPVEVAPLAADAEFRFKLIHGAHRFYCAVAAGFSHVPAVQVIDVWGD
jgi:hypothetical protein